MSAPKKSCKSTDLVGLFYAGDIGLIFSRNPPALSLLAAVAGPMIVSHRIFQMLPPPSNENADFEKSHLKKSYHS